jgi:phosphatidate phosphatase APP1
LEVIHRAILIYASITQKLPGKIFAIYIRSFVEENAAATKEILTAIESNGAHTCLFKTSIEAIEHSKLIGLISSM